MPACSYACFAALRRERVDVGQDLARLFPRVGREHRRRDLHRALLLLERQRLQLGVAHDDRGRGAVAVRRAHRPRVRVGDHDVVHDLVEREPLLVARERVQRRVRVVLLGDLGEQLEVDAAVLVAVLHADLREHARHRLGADAAVDRRDRAVAARAASTCRRRCARAPPASRPAPASFSTPTARPMSHSPAFTAMIAVRSAVAPVAHAFDDVVHGDAGLADLLLQRLADAAPRRP